MIADEKAQISAEMLLIFGALIVIVIVAGLWISSIASTIAGNITQVIDAAKNSVIGRMSS